MATRATPGRAPIGPAALLREALLWTVPGLAGLLLLGLLGPITPLGWVLAVAAVLALALALATQRLRVLEEFAAWIEDLPGGASGHRPSLHETRLVARLGRPVAGLARRLRREADRNAALQLMLASVIEAMPDPILVVDRELEIVRSNAAARRELRLDEPVVPLARGLRDPGVLAAVKGALAGSASSVTFTPTRDRHKQFSARIEPVELGESGRGVLIALREQTEQVMIERMRSDFVANASHEIRNPLAAIQGIVETLRGPARDDPKARAMFLEVMEGEAARMGRLVDDLLSLSRIELAANQPPRERCNLDDVLKAVVSRMVSVAAPARVRLVLELPEGLPAVTGDDDQLHQLFVNLIDNAIKHGGGGRAVTVSAEALPAAPAEAGPVGGRACVAVHVRDEGPGIVREHIPRLTERFYRVDKGRSRRVGGTGLGLAIAKHILRRHQGHLTITSEPSRGSVFSVYLPSLPRSHGSVTKPS